MTKHCPGQGALVLPSLSHLGEYHDHQLDSHGQAPSFCSVVRCTTGRQQPAQMVPLQPPRLEKADAHPGHLLNATALVDKPVSAGSSHPNPQGDARKQVSPDSWSGEQEKSSTGGGKKKNYQRYPKPPYSYLAMIAMVIQRSPEKKLTLSEVRTIFKSWVEAKTNSLVFTHAGAASPGWFSWVYFSSFCNNSLIEQCCTRDFLKILSTLLSNHYCS